MTAIRNPRRLAPIAATIILASLLLTTQLIHAFASSSAPRVAFVARSDNPVDALAAGAVAAQVGGVVLLTSQTGLGPDAADGLASYQPDLVILAGGHAALSEQVETDLDGLGYTWERVAGSTRTHTAQLLAERLATLDKTYLGVDGTAVNSEKLQGRTGSELTRAASFETGDALAQPPGPAGVIMPAGQVEITAPKPGWIVVHGGTSISRSSAGNVNCFFRFDGAVVAGSARSERAHGPASCQTASRIKVPTGTHTVALLVSAPQHQQGDPTTQLTLGHRSVVATYVPFDGAGAGLAPDGFGG